MALINCPECGKQISNKSVFCINCGYPLEDKDRIDEKNIVEDPFLGVITEVTDEYIEETRDNIKKFSIISDEYLNKNRHTSSEYKKAQYYINHSKNIMRYIDYQQKFFEQWNNKSLSYYNKALYTDTKTSDFIKGYMESCKEYFIFRWSEYITKEPSIYDSIATIDRKTISLVVTKNIFSGDLYRYEIPYIKGGYITISDLKKYSVMNANLMARQNSELIVREITEYIKTDEILFDSPILFKLPIKLYARGELGRFGGNPWFSIIGFIIHDSWSPFR